MQKFKNFLDNDSFDQLSKELLATPLHKKPEHIQILLSLARRQSDFGNHDHALQYVKRCEKIADELLNSEENEQYLYIWLAKVEILLKKPIQSLTDDPAKIALKAKDLAMKIYGEKTFITNQAMLTYAMTLTRKEETVQESLKQFTKAEKLFTVINNEISFKEGCNLLFNMLLHYNFMLNDFGSTFDPEKKKEMVRRLNVQVEVGNHNVLTKKALVTIQRFFIHNDKETEAMV